MRIRGGENPLDITAVHPESYPVVEQIAAHLGVPIEQLIQHPEALEKVDKSSVTAGVFTLNAALGRTFRLDSRYSLDLRVDATNPLNHVTYTGWNTAWTSTSTQFGLPQAANAMRSLQTNLRLRF